MNNMTPRLRPRDDSRQPGEMSELSKFLRICAMATASWIVFGSMLYGLWKGFVWMLDRVPVWMS